MTTPAPVTPPAATPPTGLITTPAPAAAPVAPAAVTPPAAIQWPENWRDGLPADLKDDPSMKVVTDIPNLAKAYVHAQRAIGMEKIVLPGKNATDEEWNQIYRKLGVPEKADDYPLEKPQGTKYTDAEIKSFKEQAHKLGLQPKQAANLLGWLESKNLEAMKAAETAQSNTRAQWLQETKAQFGTAFDSEVAGVKAVFREFGDPQAKEFLESTGLTDNPHLVRVFAKVAKLLGEDKLRAGGGDPLMLTPDLAQKEINKIMGDKSSPYWDKGHPAHGQVVAEMARLQAMKHGQKE
jgi:hypothetical protein